MKSIYFRLGVGLVSLLVGCASTPVVFAPVGPDPVGIPVIASQGELQVYSSLAEQSDDQNQGGNNPVWFQHTDYRIYDSRANLVRRVDNTIGHYDTAPRLVPLPPGTYLVKARAENYLPVVVPVTVVPGRTTRVYLDDQWQLPADTPKKELVSLPDGSPVGWCAESTTRIGIN
jgi:hypothetical protein